MRHRLEKYPADFSAHFNLGALLLSRKDAASAIGYLRDALRVQPEQPAALNTLGVALESEGRLDEAIKQFRRAQRARPDFTDALYNLAHALTKSGDVAARRTAGSAAEAIVNWWRWNRRTPTCAAILNRAGAPGDLRSAIEQFERAG
jgi:tetratricopeptide (TPR) repeat protein